MRKHNSKPQANVAAEVILGVWILVGLFGAIWISDDFDYERLSILLFAGIPALAVYLSLWALKPNWVSVWPRFKIFLNSVIYISFFAGIFPLLNAATMSAPSVKRSFSSGTRVVERNVYKGGLGTYFQRRF